MAVKIRSASHLSPNAWVIRPDLFRQTMTTKELRETLLHFDGRILAHGGFYRIASKRIGPGVYVVTLVDDAPAAPQEPRA